MSGEWINHELISYLKEAIYDAGDLSIKLRNKGLEVYKKPDGSPVSNGDIAVSDFIYSKIKDLAFGHEIICEEKIDSKKEYNLGNQDFFWLIDPIDGTRSYIKNEDSFTINIALIHNKKPKLGFIYQPAKNILHYTDEKNRLRIEKDKSLCYPEIHPSENGQYIAVVSSNHFNNNTKTYLDRYNFSKIISVASSVKLCIIADGTGDVFPKFGPTMEWDIAAGHALINASGGALKEFDDKEMTYAKKGFKNPHFIAYSKRLQING